MGKDDALYPSYPGNPQTNLADYPDTPSETGLAHASDYNKLDNEILKHQEVLNVDIPATYMPFTGGTFTGFITLSADPTAALHAATKQYVDNSIAVENLWDRTAATSTLEPHTANDNVDIGSGDFDTSGTGTLGALSVDDLSIDGSSILAGAGVSGILTLGGTGGSNNENLTLDFESLSNVVVLGTGTAVTRLNSSLAIRFNDSVVNYYGTDLDWAMVYSLTGNDNAQIGVKCGTATTSGYLSLMETADINNANRSPASTSANPVWRVYSSDANEANDYIEMYHDQTDGQIVSGGGDINIAAATDVNLNGTLSYMDFSGNALWDFDGGRIFLGNAGYKFIIGINSGGTAVLLAPYDTAGNQIIVTNNLSGEQDHDHATQTNPTFFIHSDLTPNTSNNQWGSLHHDQEDFIITTGANVGEGTGATTDDNGIWFAPRGSKEGKVSGGGDLLWGIGARAIPVAGTDRRIRVYSEDDAVATDYMEMYHNQTDGVIKVETGNLIIDAADGTLKLNVGTTQSTIFARSLGLDQTVLSTSDAVGNHIVIASDNSWWKDFDHAVQTNPTLYIHSDTDPDTANDEWISFTHDVTDGYIDVGSGDVKVNAVVNAVGGFEDNGTAGIDTTFLDADGNTITVLGGIITAKTAP